MTPLENCIVLVQGEKDHTTDLIMRRKGPSLNGKKFPLKHTASRQTGQSVGTSKARDETSQRATGSNVPKRTRLHHRVHYQLVFKEVARPIDMETKLSHVFLVVRDVTHGKILLFLQVNALNVII